MGEENGSRAQRFLKGHLDEERPSGVDVFRLVKEESALRGIREEDGDTFGVSPRGLFPVEVVGEISALDDQRSGVHERLKASRKGTPLVGVGVPPNGDGQHERIREVMDDKGEQRMNSVFVREKV